MLHNFRKTTIAKRFSRSITRLMGAGENAIPQNEIIFVKSTPTTQRISSVIANTRSPSNIRPSTPQRGASSSSVITPIFNRTYHNQGRIQVNNTENGTKKLFDASLFFLASCAPQDNQVSFPKMPPEEFQTLKEKIQKQQQEHKQLGLALPEIITVTSDSIQKIHQNNHLKRRPDNKSVMGKLSAKDAKKLGNLPIDDHITLQWLHIKAAYLTGEYDAKLKRSKSQVSTNLILGTREGNAHMLMIELAIKHLLDHKELNIKDITQSETIEWIPGYEDIIAKTIHYKIGIPGCEIIYDINPWILNKVPDNKQELINEFVQSIILEAQSKAIPKRFAAIS